MESVPLPALFVFQAHLASISYSKTLYAGSSKKKKKSFGPSITLIINPIPIIVSTKMVAYNLVENDCKLQHFPYAWRVECVCKFITCFQLIE